MVAKCPQCAVFPAVRMTRAQLKQGRYCLDIVFQQLQVDMNKLTLGMCTNKTTDKIEYLTINAKALCSVQGIVTGVSVGKDSLTITTNFCYMSKN